MRLSRPQTWLLVLAAVAACVSTNAIAAPSAVAYSAPAWTPIALPTGASPAPPVIVRRWVDCMMLGPKLAAHFAGGAPLGAAYESEMSAEVSDPNGLSDIILVSATSPAGPLYKLYDDGTYGDMTPGDGIFHQRLLAPAPAAPGDWFFFADDSRTLTDASWDIFYPASQLPFPSLPMPLAPLDAATIQTTTPLLAWQGSVNATAGYAVWIWDELPTGIGWSWSHVVWLAQGLADTTVAVPAGILQPGRTYYWWVVARDVDPVEGNSRAAAEGASFSVDSSGAIAGQVRVSGTTATIADAIVRAYSGDQLWGSATTGADGMYAIAGLAEGQYRIVAQKQGYVSQSKDGIAVASGQTTYVNFGLPISGRLKGQVTELATGAPIIGATVTARSSGVVRATATTTAPWGIYEVATDLAAGTYSLNASKAGYVDQGKTGIAVSEGATTYVNFRLTPPPILKGQVRDRSTGAPVIGATVAAFLGGVLRGTATTSSPWGIYEIYGEMPAGAYSINASKAGYTDQRKAGIVVASGATTYVNFNLQPY